MYEVVFGSLVLSMFDGSINQFEWENTGSFVDVDLLCDELKKMCRFELKSKMSVCNVHVAVCASFHAIQFSFEQLHDGSIVYF